VGKQKIVIIGGGAAGMMAAIAAAEAGAVVTVIERNQQLGRKLAITGKGRCNLTNNCTVEEVLKNIPGNGRFLYSALNAFDAFDLMQFFEGLDVPLKTERGKRVFPQSDDAHDIVNALDRKCQSCGVKFVFSTRVQKLLIADQAVIGVICEDGSNIEADAVIVATGGKSYPLTGSSGDGYRLAKQAGHTVIPLRPSLAPLETKEHWPTELSGLALKNVEVTAYYKEKILGCEFGEMLFTHFGVSGPIILTLSHYICRIQPLEKVRLSINLKPALSVEQLDARIQRDLDKYSRKQLQNSLGDLLPQSLIPVILNLSEIPPEKFSNQISRAERQKLGSLLQNLPLEIKSARPLAEAIVTAGGVAIKEIEPKTMASKLVKGLYFAGEVIDIDGFTGGFNLTAAFSTGRAAGLAAAIKK